MSVRHDFNDMVKEDLDNRVECQGNRPGVEVWPQEEDFGRWVASHEDRVRTVICESPEFKDSPFCGSGYH